MKMGKRLKQKELLEEIDRERTLLDQTLELIPKRLMTKAGVTRGGWSVKDVLADYHSYHERTVRLIKALPDADLITLGRYSWTGPSWTLSDYLRASTAAHYLWARTRIRRWWKKQSGNRHEHSGR